MDSDAAFLSGLDVFGRVVNAVPADAWDNPSPCEGWTALDVLGHIVGVLDIGAQILAGEPPDYSGAPERPSELVGADPTGRYAAAADRARAGLVGVDLDRVRDSPMGPRPIRDGLAFPAMDLHLHAWDLGRSVGIDVAVDDEVQDFVHARLDPMPDEMKRSPGVFGPELAAPDGASSTDRLMAWTGRTL